MPGFGWAIHRLSGRGKRQKCPRCGLRFPAIENKCTYCDELDPFELQELKSKIQQASRSNRSLGKLFLLTTIVLTIVMLFYGFSA